MTNTQPEVLERAKLLPCPFCGETPEACDPEDHYGTYYEFQCDCGCARAGVQICDLMSIDERQADDFINHQYGREFIVRAMNHCIDMWNDRVKPVIELPTPFENEFTGAQSYHKYVVVDVIESQGYRVEVKSEN